LVAVPTQLKEERNMWRDAVTLTAAACMGLSVSIALAQGKGETVAVLPVEVQVNAMVKGGAIKAFAGGVVENKPPAYVMSEIELAEPGAYAPYLPRAQSTTIGPNVVAAENPVSLFRVIIVVHGISSDWNETFLVNPEYPSLEMCEAARGDLVEDFLHILKRRYLQPFNVDSKCARSDGDTAVGRGA
jgi:hypothetical protein